VPQRRIQSPNPRLQRTRSALLRSPLCRKLLGGGKAYRAASLAVIGALTTFGCEGRDCSRVVAAHAAVKPGMTLVEAIGATEAAQLPDLQWVVRSGDSAPEPFEVSRDPYRIRFYSRVSAQGLAARAMPYQESGYSTRGEFLAALQDVSARLAASHEAEVSMGCLRGGLNWETFTIKFGPDQRVAGVSAIQHVRF